MSEISAKLVMELRNETNLSMMKCKEALTASNGDKAAAKEWLRKNNATGAKFADRDTPNGSAGMAIGGGHGVLVLLGCQTDFVSSNEVFKALVKDLADLALASGAASVDALSAQQLHGVPVAEALLAAQLKIGEKVALVKVLRVTGAVVSGYNHGGRVAAIVAGSGDAERLRKIAMHVASSSPAPVGLDRASVDPALVAKEREILLGTPEVQSKPEAMRGKIVDGKLNRFFKEQVLLEQEMLLDAEKGETVQAYAKRTGCAPTGFIRCGV